MNIVTLPFTPALIPQMVDLALQFPDRHLHLVDLPYRFCSWALDEPQNVGIWINDSGELIGWTVAQYPFSALDYAFNPQYDELEATLLDWGILRWHTLANKHNHHEYFMVGAMTKQKAKITQLKTRGFTQDSWSLLHLIHASPVSLPSYSLPSGYTLRPLKGHSAVP